MAEVTLATTAELATEKSAREAADATETKQVPTPYQRYLHRGGTRLDAPGAAVYPLVEGAVSSNPAVGGGPPPANAFYFDPADYAITGLTLKMRLRALFQVNSTAPATSLTVAMHPITSPTGGAATLTATVGTAAEGTAAKSESPAKNTQVQVSAGDFTPPAAGFYVLCVTVAGAAAANSSVMVGAELEMRWV